MNRTLHLVLVPSTHCNLRCQYCYELPLLADKRRMSLDELSVVFERIAQHCVDSGAQKVRVIWHGGEPLLIPPEYYWAAFERQARAFAGTGIQVRNVTQTNLTILDDARLELLEHGFADRGVSLDVFGSLRVNGAGDAKEDLVKANLDRVLSRGIRINGITVLHKGNRNRVRDVYDFYRARGMNFRLLPLHRGGYAPGQWFEIEPRDTLRAFCELADLWLAAPDGPWMNPVVGVLRDVYLGLALDTPLGRYDKRTWEGLLYVTRDGSVYPYSDAFDEQGCYGNILRQPVSELVSSPARDRVLRRIEQRVDATCGRCSHFGQTCTGAPVAESEDEFEEKDAQGQVRCTIFQGLVDHVSRRLIESGVVAQIQAGAFARLAEPEARVA
jgi:uncharacterized protein